STMIAWVTRLEDGAPIAGATIEERPYGLSGTTNGEGLSQLPLKEAAGIRDVGLLIARHEEDSTFVPEYEWANSSTRWIHQATPDYLRFVDFDDRGMYRPGEKVRIKGWIRRYETKK